MKNRIIKSGIIVAVVTLVLFNIQVLSDTTGNTIFPGSTVSAVEDPTKPPNTDYLEHAYLKMKNCLDWGAVVDFTVTPPYSIGVGLFIGAGGVKYVCKNDFREISCYLPAEKPCSIENAD